MPGHCCDYVGMAQPAKNLCPCCGYRTLPERGAYEICPVCFWEDDGQCDDNADIVMGGPNKDLSLTAARANFSRIGAADERWLAYVRAPTAEEKA